MSGGMTLEQRRAALVQACAALEGLAEELWTAGGGDLGSILTLVDDVAGLAAAGRLAVLSEAVERGEAGGTTNTWDTVEARYPDWRKEGKFLPLVALSLEKDSTLPEVPTLGSMIADPRHREVVDFLVTGSQVGRAFAAPPDVPADRLAALRRAFDLTMKDPEFRAAMAKARLPVEPTPGAKVQPLVDGAAAASKDLVARARAAVGLQ